MKDKVKLIKLINEVKTHIITCDIFLIACIYNIYYVYFVLLQMNKSLVDNDLILFYAAAVICHLSGMVDI